MNLQYFKDHLESHVQQNQSQYFLNPVGFHPRENMRAESCSQEYPQHGRSGNQGIDVPSEEIDECAGRGGNPDHEIAGSNSDLERHAHVKIHHRNFYYPAPYSQ